MTPYQHSIVYVMSTDPNTKFPRFKNYPYQSDKKNFNRAVLAGLDNYLETITQEDDWFEVETLDAIADKADNADEYDEISKIINNGVEELLAVIKSCKKPKHFIFAYNNLIGPVPNRYQQEIVSFCEDVGIDYEINPTINSKDVDYIINEIEEAWRDAEAERRDPYGYRGLRRSDFI